MDPEQMEELAEYIEEGRLFLPKDRMRGNPVERLRNLLDVD